MDTQELILLGGAVGLLLVLIIGYYFIRWVFNIKRQLWNQQATITLLLRIAEKQGVTGEDIVQIKEQNNLPVE